MQRRVQSCQGTWPTQLPGDLDGGPRGRRRQSASDPFQRCTHSLVDRQADGGPHPHARVKHMNGASVFEIETVQRGSRAHAWNSMLFHEEIKRGQPADEVWLGSAVHAPPYADETAVSNLNIQLLTRHDCQQLSSCGETTKLF
jgi:hypothetical protein